MLASGLLARSLSASEPRVSAEGVSGTSDRPEAGSGLRFGGASALADVDGGRDDLLRRRRHGQRWFQALESEPFAVSKPWNDAPSRRSKGADSTAATQDHDAAAGVSPIALRVAAAELPQVSLEGAAFQIPGVGIVMKPVRGGEFVVPATPLDDGAGVGRRVRVGYDFWIGCCEVTQEQYEKVTGARPSWFSSPNRPVERVSWHDAKAFGRRVTEREQAGGRLPAGYEYRLPTESEWDYAAWGGLSGGRRHRVCEDDFDAVAWYGRNSSDMTHVVGMKPPNELGLHDMFGNVWEWCWDGVTREGEGDADVRAIRGGGFLSSAAVCLGAERYGCAASSVYPFLGFRIVLAPVR